MTLSELRERIDALLKTDRNAGQSKVVVAISLPYVTMGGSPCSEVTELFNGFDWDSGKLFICTKDELTISDEKIKEIIWKMEKQVGALSYENVGLKSQIKKLKEQA